jgi:fucose 4-O-acetylase-like acetyltransferase
MNINNEPEKMNMNKQLDNQDVAKGSPRVGWVDYAKGIGIILVVYGHVLVGLDNAGIIQQAGSSLLRNISLFSLNWTYSFHMAMFFFLSGLFAVKSKNLDISGFKISIQKKTSSILYPYLIWSLIQGILNAVMSSYTNAPFDISSLPFRIALRPLGHFWFLYILFAYHIIFTIMDRFLSRPVVIGLSFLTYIFAPHIHIYLIKAFAERFLFFVIGATLGSEIFKILRSLSELTISAILTFSLLCHTLIFGFFYFAFDMKEFNSQLLMFGLFGCLGTTSIIMISLFLDRWSIECLKIIAKLGSLSMPIYLAHLIVIVAVRIALHKFIGISNLLIHIPLETFLGLLIPVVIYDLSRKHNFEFLFNYKPKEICKT